MGKTMKIAEADITTLDVDAIVNAANRSLLGGGGVDGAIHKAAGPKLLEATKKLGGAKTGEAKITEGFDLPAKYVIHAVGPIYRDGTENEPEFLASCYENALKLADDHQLQTIAFSAISTGVYGYPIAEATEIAVKSVQDLLGEMKFVEEVTFVVFNEEIKEAYETTFEQLGIQDS
jgi:O-acetyl-ADP-ribose deacetylase (regulator of RNase III)